MDKWFCYVLRCENGSLYRGITNDVERRFRAHCAGKGAKYTRMHKPVEIVYVEEVGSKSEAAKREAYLKTDAGRIFIREKIAKAAEV